jgi:hypothetical protein
MVRAATLDRAMAKLLFHAVPEGLVDVVRALVEELGASLYLLDVRG